MKKFFLVFLFLFISITLAHSESYYIKKTKDIYLVYMKSNDDVISSSEIVKKIILPSVPIFFNKNLKISKVRILDADFLGKVHKITSIYSQDIFKNKVDYLQRPRYCIDIVIQKYLTNLKKYVYGFKVLFTDLYKSNSQEFKLDDDEFCSIANQSFLKEVFSKGLSSVYKLECLGRAFIYSRQIKKP